LDQIPKYFWPHYLGVKLSLNKDIETKTLVYCDVSEANIMHSKEKIDKLRNEGKVSNLPENIFGVVINHDKWPFKDNSIDCIVNNLYFHNTDSLEDLLKRYNKSLVSDGCLVGNVFTYHSMLELRRVLTLAENEREGGVSQNVITFPRMQELGAMLSKTNFNLPSISINNTRLYFDDLVEIFEFIKAIGETNFLANRRLYKSSDTYLAAIALYQQLFNKEKDESEIADEEVRRRVTRMKFTENLEDFVYLTLEVTAFISWKYDESQQKPKERGSAEFNMKDLAEETLKKNEDPTLRIGRIKPTENEDEFEIEDLTDKIKQKIIDKLGKDKVDEKLESKDK
jgi:NADH dehydrogenase [ubiquinone] 1 alpha subcomplex assembly factor 5